MLVIKERGLDKGLELVQEMHRIFGHPHHSSPTLMPLERRSIRFNLIKEEIEEFLNAETIEDQYDGLIDALYLIFGTLTEMGCKPDAGFEIVHEANMRKLWPDGKPRYREVDGKILKPPGWVAPEPLLRNEIQKQIEEAEEVNEV